MRAAIIGCGGIAAVHAKILAELDGVELAAFVDPKVDRASELAARYGADGPGRKESEEVVQKKVYSSMEELFAVQAVDVVHLCTPHYLHTPMALYAREKGVHVFSEKPISMNREEFTVLKEQETSAILGICLQNRYNATTGYVRRILQERSLGKVLGARAFVNWNRDEAYYRDSDWRGSWETEGGGALINQGIHTLDLLVYFLGKPQAMKSMAANHHLADVIEVEDTAVLYLQYPEFAAQYFLTTGYGVDAPVLLEIEFEKGAVRIERDGITLPGSGGETKHIRLSDGSFGGKSYWGNGHTTCIRNFYRALEKGRPAPIGLAEIEDTMELVFAFYEEWRGKI